jgi:hypothetical protein
MGLAFADGQVELHGVDYHSFVVPPCKACVAEKEAKAGVVKPNVVFFVSAADRRSGKSLIEQGETLASETKETS